MDQLSTLLIDDNPGFVAVACKLLMERFPAQVRIVATAMDGEDGLTKALALRPQLILVDLVMPGIGGVQAISVLRDLSPRSLILALSPLGAEGHGRSALEAGADAVIVKSRLSLDLGGVLHRLVARPRSVDAALGDAIYAAPLAPALAY